MSTSLHDTPHEPPNDTKHAGHAPSPSLSESSPHDSVAPDILLLIFIHGFKGTDTTFARFPERMQHLLTETLHNVTVESIVFPAYETKGNLAEAVERFSDWLTTLTVEKEVASGGGHGAGKAKIVLCGHSMGGLLAADSLLAFANTRPDRSAPLWPHIIACIAYDTPYYGLHPHVFKNSATKATEYVASAQKTASSLWSTLSGLQSPTKSAPASAAQPAGLLSSPSAGETPWSRWAPAAYAVGGALLAGAAAGAAYYRRNELTLVSANVLDHMRYVGNLWDQDALSKRVEDVLEIEKEHGVVFKTLYTILPAMPPDYTPRTFCILPKDKSPEIKAHFAEARNAMAEDEVQAHVGMFEPSTNDGYYQLGLATADIIRDALARSRAAAVDTGVVHEEQPLPSASSAPNSARVKQEAEMMQVNEAEMEDLLL
ncbi:hypothetical protein DENSPDRAFT_812059 [Dentipellis sp. KUC8613]|nr:hypothetical protein DENSPDRAFT_812059 [Dentipellis sp. KUC8613]